MNELFHYRANVTAMYDADSLTLDIDLGFGSWLIKQKVRLYGIDAFEMRGEEKVKGKIARQALYTKLGMPSKKAPAQVLVKSYKDKAGKYGRWLVTVFYEGEDLNQWLIDEGHAVAYFGGKR